MKTLSLCMIVRDEANNLPYSLGPLRPHVDEAVVVDTGSKDDTPVVAARLGAQVSHFPWQDDFSAARNFSLDQAQGDWILWLDADNRLTDADAQRLRSLVQRPGEAILWGTEVLGPDQGRLIQKRIFPRRPDIRFRYRVHEQLEHPPGMAQVFTPIKIFHWGYQDRETFRAKGRRNFVYLTRELQERPHDYYVHYQLARYHFYQGELSQAPVHLDQVLASPTAPLENSELYRHAGLLKALTWRRLGYQTRATHLLRDLLVQYPHYGLAWYYWGMWNFQAGRFQDAAQALKCFLDQGSGHLILDQPEEKLLLTALLSRGRALWENNLPQEAQTMLNQAQEQFPHHIQVWLEKAELALSREDRPQAQAALEVCLTLRLDNRRAQLLRRRLEGAGVPAGHYGHELAGTEADPTNFQENQ